MINLDEWPHRWYGRWREDPDARADEVPGIRDAMGFAWEARELKKVVGYLRSGVIAIASPGIVKSVLDETKVIGTPSWRTDGVWLWPDTLAYYVEAHGVCLPPPFIRHIRGNKYSVPAVGENEMKALDWPMGRRD